MNDIKKQTKNQKRARAEARDMAKRLASEAETLQKKAEERLINIDTKELSASDTITILTEGVNLERICLLKITNLDPGLLIEPNIDALAHIGSELEKLSGIDVNQLAPVETVRFLLAAIKLEWACLGIPKDIADTRLIEMEE